jgi:hypothetical protein
MATFLSHLLRAGGRPVPHKMGNLPRRTPAPSGASTVVRTSLEQPPTARPIVAATVEPSKLQPRAQPYVTEATGQAESHSRNRVVHERRTDSSASSPGADKSERTTSEPKPDLVPSPKQEELNPPDVRMEKARSGPAHLPRPHVESTHLPLTHEMEARFTGRRDVSVAGPIVPGKVPYIEFVAKGKVVSSFGPLPTAASPTAPRESERDLPPVPSALDAGEKKRASQGPTSAVPFSPSHIEQRDWQPVEKRSAAVQPASIVRSAANLDAASKVSLIDPTERQGATRQATNVDPRVKQAIREADNSINIKRIDIQILNEEPQKTVRQPRLANPDEGIAARLDRHYIREVV